MSMRLTPILFMVLWAVILFLIMSWMTPARAHDADHLEEWLNSWVQEADTSLSPELIIEYQDMTARHEWYFDPQPIPLAAGDSVTTGYYLTGEADWWKTGQWLPLVAGHFSDLGATHVNIAICVVYGESRGTHDVTHSGSGARGLFQILPGWADNAWAGTQGISYADFLVPELNVFVARKVWDKQGWGAWSAYRRAYVQECIVEGWFYGGYNRVDQ